jgi:2-keto-4-pentenoate hydratase/2-oxohepta-3-ene-1,7-dioic acid hydratase in catechol pathway
MRVISYNNNGTHGVGVMLEGGDDKGFVDLCKAAPELPTDLRKILDLDPSLEIVRNAVAGKAADMSIDDVEFDPVVREPHAIWALALNFKTHIAETGLTTSPDHPHIFMRHSTAHVGHLCPLLAPDPELGRAFDYEGELAVIIGRKGRHIPREKAFDHIAGFSIYNEGSVREFQKHNRQFGLGKNFEKSGSVGPWLVTPDEFGDPKTKSVKTEIGGVVRQDAPLNDMLFDVEAVIGYLSTGYTLQPGDIIVMGTPGALPPKPGDDAGDIKHQFGPIKYAGMVHMKPGDEVHVSIDGIGTLSNPVIADQPAAYRAD